MKINRKLKKSVEKFKSGRINMLYGPRRSGKTTLVKEILSEFSGAAKYTTGDDERIKEIFNSNSLQKITEFTENLDLIVIDEAQRIENIGWGLKILIDSKPNLKVIATGSASFELAGQVGEPLTGRKFEYTMLPISIEEDSVRYVNAAEFNTDLNTRLIYGTYPEVLLEKNKTDKQNILLELVNSLLLKDILELERVKSSKILLDLLRMISFQVGSEVSETELAQKLGIDYKTVGRYLDLFEKSYILLNVRGYSKNLRKEITKKSKYYFFDNGIRNALISNFNNVEIRNDIGILWENYLVSERLKFQFNNKIFTNNYFWRTWDQQEIDWVEEREGKLFAYEFKYSSKQSAKKPRDFQGNYPESEFNVINSDNYLDWLV